MSSARKENISSISAKVLRMCLAFALAFSTSFCLQGMAWAALLDGVADDVAGLEVWQAEEGDVSKLGRFVAGTAEEHAGLDAHGALKLRAVGDSAVLIAFPVKSGENGSGGDAATAAENAEWSIADISVAGLEAVGAIPDAEPGSEEPGGDADPDNGNDDAVAADEGDAEGEVGDGGPDEAELPENGGEEEPQTVEPVAELAAGAVKIVAREQGETSVTCKLPGAGYGSGKSRDLSVVIDISVGAGERSVEISAIEFIDESGVVLPSELELSKKQREKYQLRAKISVSDIETGDRETSYIVGGDANLSDLTDGMLSDVTWKLRDEGGNEVPAEDGTVSDSGELSLSTQETVFVWCVSAPGEGASAGTVSASLRIPGSSRPDEDELTQGASHPQDALRIVAEWDEKVISDVQSGENAPSEEPEGEPAPEPAGDDGLEQAEAVESTGESEDVGESGEPPAEPGETLGQDSGHRRVDRSYSPEELASLGLERHVYAMTSPDGEQTSQIDGEGVLIARLLEDAGVGALDRIESLTFSGYGGTASVSWNELVSSQTPAMMALRSFVLSAPGAEGTANEPASPAPEGESASSLLPNTRFRALFDSSAAIGSPLESLCYINTIQVNIRPLEEEDEHVNPELAVRIDYVPVPKGATALLSAIPSGTGDKSFAFDWERSDDGVTWETLGEYHPSLRVLTDDESIGTQYRVTLISILSDDEEDAGEDEDGNESESANENENANENEDADENVEERLFQETDPNDPYGFMYSRYTFVVSEPITITVGDGFAVILAYNPPFNGGTAVFQSSILGYDGDVSQIRYTWEYTMDSGLNWDIIEDENSPTYVIDEVGDADEEEGEADPNVMIYIRVKASAPDGRTAISNAQPLVFLSEEAPGGDIILEPDVIISDGDGPDGSDDGSGSDSIVLREIPDIITMPDAPDGGGRGNFGEEPEDESEEEAEDEHENSTVPVPSDTPADSLRDETSSDEGSPESAPDAVYMDPDVSDAIKEQQDEIDKAVKERTPGMRWKAITNIDDEGGVVDEVLAENPLAPFVLPAGIGFLFAGGLEKALAFRRETD